MTHEEDRNHSPFVRVAKDEPRDGLPAASLGRVQDVRPQSSVAHPLDDLTEFATIGLDDEVDRQAVGGACLGWAGDGQRSSGSNQACGPLRVAAEDIEKE